MIFFLGAAGSAPAQTSTPFCPQAIEQLGAGRVLDSYQLAQRCLLATEQSEGIGSAAYADGLRLLTRIASAAGDYPLALTWVRREVATRARLTESLPLAYGEALQEQAVLYLRVGSLEAAQRSLTEAQRAFQAADAPPPLRLPYLLAKVYHSLGHLRRADSLYQRVIAAADRVDSLRLRDRATYFRSQLPTPTAPSADSIYYRSVTQFGQSGDTLSLAYADACYRLANALVNQDHWRQASRWYRRALGVYQAIRPIDSLSYAGVLHNLGIAQLPYDSTYEAIGQLTQAYHIRQRHYTPQAGAWWTSLDNLANALYRSDRPDEAAALYETLEETDTTYRYPGQYAVALSNRATQYHQEQQYALAEAYYARASRHLENHPPTTSEQELQQAAIYGNRGRNQQKLAHFDSAIYYFKRSTEIIRRIRGTQSSAYVAAVSGMAGLYHDLGYFVESDIFYQEALRIQRKLSGDTTNAYANLLNNYALVCQVQGQFTKATELLNRSLQIKEALLGANHPDYGQALANVGLVYLEAARYRQARPMLEQALAAAVAQYGESHPSTSSARINLARLEMAEGNYPSAEQQLQTALVVTRAHFAPTHPEYARVRIELANFYLALGNYGAAKPLFLAGRQTLRDWYGAEHPEYATATQNLAGLYEAIGEVDTAEVLYQEVLRIDRQSLGKQHASYATALNNLAALYQNQERYDQAKPLLEESLDISRTLYGEEHPRHLTTLLNLGLLYQSTGNYAPARECIERVVAVRRKTLNDQHPDYAFSLYAQAALYHRLGDPERAAPIFREVMQRYTQQLQTYFPALSEKEKSAFYQRVEPVLQAIQHFIVDQVIDQTRASADTREALLGDFYNLQLLTKAMLLNVTSQIRAAISRSNDEALISRYQQWVATKEALIRRYALSPAEWQQQQDQVEQLEDRANALEKELSLRSTQFADDLRDRRFTWRDIRQQLQPHEAAVEIVRIEKGKGHPLFYIALAITSQSESPSAVLLSDGEAMESKNIYYYQNAIDFRVPDGLSYDQYWEPIASLLPPQTTTVYVAPDGVYHKINLNSVLNPRTKRFLVEEKAIRTLSSTRELLRSSRVVTPRQAYLLGAPRYRISRGPAEILKGENAALSPELAPTADRDALRYPVDTLDLYTLPGTEQEVNQIAQLLRHHRWTARTYLAGEAQEEVVKSLAAPPRLLHIATHGYFLSNLLHGEHTTAFGLHLPNATANPLLRSGLLLAGAANTLQQPGWPPLGSGQHEDGILTAYEAKNLNLSGTELVVMSACETGLGEIRNGEGVYGLQRAFLVAGAEGVLMSLWKVDDQSTLDLMKVFYKRWLGGADKATALREAQLTVMRTRRDPYYWGAFVLMGR
ncbi:MAG: CHAT domain-containing tetratricopeptide repeat protein [Tunicatimonas sp.]